MEEKPQLHQDNIIWEFCQKILKITSHSVDNTSENVVKASYMIRFSEQICQNATEGNRQLAFAWNIIHFLYSYLLLLQFPPVNTE